MKNLHITSSSKCNTVRKTFKKLYEQKDLVRNNKDQYGAICDNIWQQSYQRLQSSVRPAPQNAQRLKPTKIDFFDLNSNKNIMNSQNQKHIKINYITPYKHNWISLLSDQITKNFDWIEIASLAKSSTSSNYSGVQLSDAHSEAVPHTGGHQGKVVIKNVQIKATRKNTAKMLQHQDTSNLKEGRSVVNIALEKYSKRVKIKTLGLLDLTKL